MANGELKQSGIKWLMPDLSFNSNMKTYDLHRVWR